MARIQIELLECLRGHGVRSISIGDTRVTGFKCCGSWQTIQSWAVDADGLIETIQRADLDAMAENGRKNKAKISA